MGCWLQIFVAVSIFSIYDQLGWQSPISKWRKLCVATQISLLSPRTSLEIWRFFCQLRRRRHQLRPSFSSRVKAFRFRSRSSVRFVPFVTSNWSERNFWFFLFMFPYFVWLPIHFERTGTWILSNVGMFDFDLHVTRESALFHPRFCQGQKKISFKKLQEHVEECLMNPEATALWQECPGCHDKFHPDAIDEHCLSCLIREDEATGWNSPGSRFLGVDSPNSRHMNWIPKNLRTPNFGLLSRTFKHFSGHQNDKFTISLQLAKW